MTLVELLCAVAVLAVVGLIAVFIGQSVLFGTRGSTVEQSAKAVARQANSMAAFNSGADVLHTTEANIDAALLISSFDPADGWLLSVDTNSIALTKGGSTSVFYICIDASTTPHRAVPGPAPCS
jgi:type II secretory pathway pseudopilin PulG